MPESFPFRVDTAGSFQISPPARPGVTKPASQPPGHAPFRGRPPSSQYFPTSPRPRPPRQASFPVRWMLIGPEVGSEGGLWGRCRSDSAGGVRRWRRRVALSIITTIINSSSSPPQGLRRRRHLLPHHSARAWPRGPPQPLPRRAAWPPSPPRGTA